MHMLRDILSKRFNFPFYEPTILGNIDGSLRWFEEHKHLIGSVYTTPSHLDVPFHSIASLVKPYTINNDDKRYVLSTLRQMGIGINIIINNVWDVVPTKYLETIAENSDIVTVPNHDYKNIIKNHGCRVKNTAINMARYDNVVNGEYDDYDVIMIHDFIAHNHDKWLKIKKNRVFSTIVNIMCTVDCCIKDHHYKLLNDGISERYFCPIAKTTNKFNVLRASSLPLCESEYEYYSDVIDEYKLAGRASHEDFRKAQNIVEYVDSGFPPLPEYQDVTWMHHVRNCGGQCSRCNWCTMHYIKYENSSNNRQSQDFVCPEDV